MCHLISHARKADIYQHPTITSLATALADAAPAGQPQPLHTHAPRRYAGRLRSQDGMRTLPDLFRRGRQVSGHNAFCLVLRPRFGDDEGVVVQRLGHQSDRDPTEGVSHELFSTRFRQVELHNRKVAFTLAPLPDLAG